MKSKTIWAAGLAAWMLGLAVAPCWAATTYTWNNGQGNMTWDTTSTNWGGTTTWANDAANSLAVFGTSGAGAVTVVSGIQANKITINAGATGYVFTGGSITIGSGGIVAKETAVIGTPITLSAQPSWVIDSGKTLTVSNFNGGADFSAGFDGTWNLSGTANTSRKFGINGGTINWSAVGVLNPNNHVGLSDGGAGTWNVTGGSLTIYSGASTGFIIANAAATKLMDISAGTVSINDGRTDKSGVFIGGTPMYSGGAANGILTVRGSGVVTILGDSTWNVMLANNSSGSYSTGTVNIATGGVLRTARTFKKGTGATAVINLDGGTLQAYGSNTDWIQTGISNYVKNGGAIIDADTNAVTINTPLMQYASSTGGVLKLGTGTLTLGGTNTYIGRTVVSNGTLVASATGTFGAGTNLTIVAGSTCTVQNVNGAIADGAYVHLFGVMNLGNGVTDTVTRLYVDGQWMKDGLWNAARDAAHFSGSGALQVIEGRPPRGTVVTIL